MEEKETFIMKDENGNEKEAEIITVIEIDNKEYVIYAVNKNEESDNIFASRIIKEERESSSLLCFETTSVFNPIILFFCCYGKRIVKQTCNRLVGYKSFIVNIFI